MYMFYRCLMLLKHFYLSLVKLALTSGNWWIICHMVMSHISSDSEGNIPHFLYICMIYESYFPCVVSFDASTPHRQPNDAFLANLIGTDRRLRLCNT
jgi:hypothetical protein